MTFLIYISEVPLELEIARLRRELALERARLDWWAQRTLDSCVMDRSGEVAVLDQHNIRTSIESARRRESAAERKRAARKRAETPGHCGNCGEEMDANGHVCPPGRAPWERH